MILDDKPQLRDLCRIIRWGAAAIFLSATAGQAQILSLPANATLQISEDSALASYDVPMGIWADGTLPVTHVEGDVTRQAWRIATPGLTSLQMLRPLREQLRNDGFEILFECQTEACGGFDFRFAVAVLPPPEMQVNLGDFRFLSAQRAGDAGPEYVTLLVSPTAQAGFVQLTRIAPLVADADALANPAPDPMAPPAAQSLAAQLDTVGRAILPGLAFATGSAMLQDQPFAALAELADYLDENPDLVVALVGHTDATGAMDSNIALSKRRATVVLDRLVSAYGADRAQLAAEGMGYLAPVASNLTAAGREANRRVEVIITLTQ